MTKQPSRLGVTDQGITDQEMCQFTQFISSKNNQAIQADKTKSFFNAAMDLNTDGKAHYQMSQIRRQEVTNTIRLPVSHSTNAFDQSKIQQKAYRANSESQNIYKEKTRAKKSLINYQ